MHNVCFFYYFFQRSLFAENYFLIAAIDLTTQGPLSLLFFTFAVFFTIFFTIRGVVPPHQMLLTVKFNDPHHQSNLIVVSGNRFLAQLWCIVLLMYNYLWSALIFGFLLTLWYLLFSASHSHWMISNYPILLNLLSAYSM